MPATKYRRKSAPVSKVTSRKRKHILFAAWADVPPEFIGVFEGTDIEVKAWCAGFTAAARASCLGGDAVTLDEIMADPKGHGIDGEAVGPLLVFAKGGN